MTLEIEAPSKAAAEKKANEAGMDVQHIQPVVEANAHERVTHRGEDVDAGGSAWVIKLIVALVVVAVIVVFALPKIRGLLHR